ncbi:MAG: hypothetical protein KatS3mg068_1166 [Candidatus Sericytochromatia bacterium]|nr:MAG: hypothetical protein KatS3mg068_1166 [Candidatus Sericytochromatia bacterium]
MKNYLFTFLDYDDVEPTNNISEQSLRKSVIFRKEQMDLEVIFLKIFTQTIEVLLILVKSKVKVFLILF